MSKLLPSFLVIFLISIFPTFAVATDAQLPLFTTPAKQVLESANAITPDGKSSIVVLSEEGSYEFDAENRMTSTTRRVYRIETPKGVNEWATIKARYHPWYQDRPLVRARVITADGVEHILDPATFTDATIHNDSSLLYSDERVYQGPLPSVAVGAVVETEVVRKDHEPFFAGGVARSFWVGFQGNRVEHTRVTVRAPKSLPLRYTTQLLPNLTTEKQEKDGIVELVFDQGPLDAIDESEASVPGDIAAYPRVIFSTGASWAAIADEYRKLSEPKLGSPEVEKLVKEEVKAASSDQEKIKKLVMLLHGRVRYTGIEFGLNSLVPQSPDETLKRGYGDCKDKAALLVSMLRAAGVQSFLALLSTGVGEDNRAEFPGMNFDHAIVVVPGKPDLWIDATAELHAVGSLPFGDRDRLALKIAPGTKELIRIPSAKPEDNTQSETREFRLPEFGMAKITETTLSTGTRAATYRRLAQDQHSKDLDKNLEGYVKNVYLADGESTHTFSDAKDLNDPARLTIEISKGKRGQTSMNDGAVYLHPIGLFNNLPEYLRATDEKENETPEEKAKHERKHDIYFDPVLDEWHYRIVAPAGFRVRALPENSVEDIGPGKLALKYSVARDGVVQADLSFNPVKGRYTPAEAATARAAIKKVRDRDGVLITFDQIGHLLQASGKTREAIEEYERLASQHPQEALHRIQIANVMLAAGMCETARAEARKATVLDPSSAQAFNALGWILQHDLICRRFEKGFDLEGSVGAYRKAIQLDPKEATYRVDLAILLEHDKTGVRYASKADLNAAIAEYQGIKEIDKAAYEQWQDNVLYTLFYAERYKELDEQLKVLPTSEKRRSLSVVSRAAQFGATAAIERSRMITSDESSRISALVSAANILMATRKYQMAAELFAAGAQGQSNAAGLLEEAELLRNTKAWKDEELTDTTPDGFVQLFLRQLILTRGHDPSILGLVSKEYRCGFKDDRLRRMLTMFFSIGDAKEMIDKQEFSPTVAADVMLSNMKLSREGDEKAGFRIMAAIPGADNQPFYVISEKGHYRLVDHQFDGAGLGRLALERLKEGDEETARKYLDWARSDHKRPGGDDPLAGIVFGLLWERGAKASGEKIRIAALALAAGQQDAKQFIPEIVEAGKGATDKDRSYLTLMLAWSAFITHDWKTARETGQELLQKYPSSMKALSIFGRACVELKDPAWEAVLSDRLATAPDRHAILRLQAELYTNAGNTRKVDEIYREILKNGSSTPEDLNSYAWNALVAGKVTPEAIEEVRRAVSTDRSPGIVHTLASLYADTGKTQEARQLLLQIMEENGMDEPDSILWYVFGRIAEDYGQSGEATACYKRVTPDDDGVPKPFSTFALTQKRLVGLTGMKETAVGAK